MLPVPSASPVPSRKALALALYGLAKVALARGDTALGENLIKKAIAVYERVYPAEERYAYGGLLITLARLRIARGDYAGAERMLLDVVRTARQEWGDGNVRTRRSIGELVHLYEAWGKPMQARQYRRYLEPAPGASAPVHAAGNAADTIPRF
jgi:tetratricopeptide (TPR) repeat protein